MKLNEKNLGSLAEIKREEAKWIGKWQRFD
jgi:hypothetical protein